MDKNWLTKSSFMFGQTDMFTAYGIMLESEPADVILPPLRSRKITIPERHGAYDFGAKYYDERGLQLNCVTIKTLKREQVREISWLLSSKSEIRIWNEPDKYYIGRIYDSAALNQVRRFANKFTLTFICEPFAYGETITAPFSADLIYRSEYQGTAPAPTYIQIINNGNTAATNIRISQFDKRENY